MTTDRKNPHAASLGRRGGTLKSEAKTATSRANGRLSGRPRNVLTLDEVRARMGAGTPVTAAQAALHIGDAYTTRAVSWCRKMATEQPDYADWWREVEQSLP